MSRKFIAGHELTPGKTVKDHIHVEGTELHVPHVLLCGEKPGPTVLISAGIHNAEYVGIQAAIELSNELEVSALRGSVIIVPLANRSGFENRTMSRVFEDGKNLNRVFPGDREGSEADKLAAMLFEVFIKNADAFIDLHCGDGYETLVPFCYYLGDTPAEETAKRMVDCINVEYVVRSRCRTGGAYNLASVQKQNAVAELCACKPVRDEHGSLLRCHLIVFLVDLAFGNRVKGACRFVKNQHWTILVHCLCQKELLGFST